MALKLDEIMANLTASGKPTTAPFVIPTKIGPRCAHIVITTNNRLAPGEPVPQLRFACDCLCKGIAGAPVAKRMSKNCRSSCGTSTALLPVPGGYSTPGILYQ